MAQLEKGRCNIYTMLPSVPGKGLPLGASTFPGTSSKAGSAASWRRRLSTEMQVMARRGKAHKRHCIKMVKRSKGCKWYVHQFPPPFFLCLLILFVSFVVCLSTEHYKIYQNVIPTREEIFSPLWSLVIPPDFEQCFLQGQYSINIC